MIDEKEAKTLATASLDLMNEYGAAIDPRTMAWANFTMALASVYAPRIGGIMLKRAEARKAERVKQAA